MRRHLPIRAFALLVAAACGAPADGDAGLDPGADPVPAAASVPLGAPFDLAVGEAAAVGPEALRVELRRLSEESRCPPDVQCVEAGNAAVVLAVESSDGGTATLALNTDRPPRVVGAYGHTLRLEALVPGPPPAGAPVDSAAYVATLVVERE